MARLRIISLSHCTSWLDVKCDGTVPALEKVSSLNEGSLCWLKLNEDRSKARRGIYKITELKRQNFIAAWIVLLQQISLAEILLFNLPTNLLPVITFILSFNESSRMFKCILN